MATTNTAPSINMSKAILKLQTFLLDLPRCTAPELLAAGSLLSRPDYNDIVTERSISHLCGYPLCANALPSQRPRKGKYRISLREHRVYDLQETYSFCSDECLVRSKAFAATLAEERRSDLASARVLEVLGLFEGNGVSERADISKRSDGNGNGNGNGEGLDKDGDLGFSKLTIKENIDVKDGEVKLEEWIGPSNAIEGYVPRIDRNQEIRSEFKPKARPEHRASKEDIGTTRNDMEFTSAVFVGDPFIVARNETPSYVPQHAGLNSDQSRTRTAMEKEKEFTSIMIIEKPTDTVASLSLYNDEAGSSQVRSLNDVDSSKWKKTLKSSLRQQGAEGGKHSVRWADVENGMDSLGKEIGIADDKNSKMSNELDDEISVRLASAEACAAALLHASEAVTSGESEAGVAVSEAGIIIMPPPQDEEDVDSEKNDNLDSGRIVEKWPKKPVLLDTDLFDVEDSWHDTPPEGFCPTLSTFATMWTTLFEWITCSSLAYIYGLDENSCDDFLYIDGREYPRKIILSDGRSFEIKQTLAGCIARALPQIVSELRLPTPISIIEKSIGQLLDTMSFVEALPPFKTKEWHVIVLLFTDALSVFRIPGLACHMVDKRILLHKVLNGAHISGEEYEIMKDLIIPLGRLPHFQLHSGA